MSIIGSCINRPISKTASLYLPPPSPMRKYIAQIIYSQYIFLFLDFVIALKLEKIIITIHESATNGHFFTSQFFLERCF